MTEKLALTVPKSTVVAPVKPDPVTITFVPGKPLAGEKLAILGNTIKLVALLALPDELVTLIGPVVAPTGTVAIMEVAVATLNVAVLTPLNETEDAPVKFVPVSVTLMPAAPLVGVNDVMVGGVVTVKLVALMAVPLAVVTLILPAVAPLGTVADIELSELTVKVVAAVVLNFTAVAPVKFVPVIVTIVPTGPSTGAKLVIVGAPAVVTVKLLALVAELVGVMTLIGPLVAPLGTTVVMVVAETTVNDVAFVPLNCTAVAPVKFIPEIVTLAPIGPLLGKKPVIIGLVSMMVSTAALGLPNIAPPVGLLSVRFNVLLPSPIMSLIIGTIKLFDVTPLPKVSMPDVVI